MLAKFLFSLNHIKLAINGKLIFPYAQFFVYTFKTWPVFHIWGYKVINPDNEEEIMSKLLDAISLSIEFPCVCGVHNPSLRKMVRGLILMDTSFLWAMAPFIIVLNFVFTETLGDKNEDMMGMEGF